MEFFCSSFVLNKA